MAKTLLRDELWEIIRPILLVHTPDPRGDRPRLDDRKALIGNLVVLKTGIPWEDLPCELGSGYGMTGWRRRRDWQADGTSEEIHGVLLGLLGRLRGADQIDVVAGPDRQQLGAGRRSAFRRRCAASPRPGRRRW
jgi:transposase